MRGLPAAAPTSWGAVGQVMLGAVEPLPLLPLPLLPGSVAGAVTVRDIRKRAGVVGLFIPVVLFAEHL